MLLMHYIHLAIFWSWNNLNRMPNTPGLHSDDTQDFPFRNPILWPTAPADVVVASGSAFYFSCLCVASAVDAVFGCDMHTQIAPIRQAVLSAAASCTCESSCTGRSASEWVLALRWTSLLSACCFPAGFRIVFHCLSAVRVETWLLIIMYTWLSSAGNHTMSGWGCSEAISLLEPSKQRCVCAMFSFTAIFQRFGCLSFALLTFNSIFEFSWIKTSHL